MKSLCLHEASKILVTPKPLRTWATYECVDLISPIALPHLGLTPGKLR